MPRQSRIDAPGALHHRSLLCYWAARELGVTMASIAKRLNLSPAAVTQSVERGERLVKENNYHFG